MTSREHRRKILFTVQSSPLQLPRITNHKEGDSDDRSETEGYRSITPALVSHNANGAIEFYKKVFGATENGGRALGPDGKVMHAELRIGDSLIFINDTMGPASALGTEPKVHPLQLHLYVPNVDEVFDRAVKAGARISEPLQNMFWGDRFGKIVDLDGHTWAIATHVEDVPAQEMEKRMRQFAAKAAAAQHG